MASIGPGIQPVKRFIFRSSPRSTAYIDPYANTRRELIVDDFFRRPNGDIGPNWRPVTTATNSWYIIAPGLAAPTKPVNGRSISIYTGGVSESLPWPADQWSEVRINTASVGSSANIGFGALVRGGTAAGADTHVAAIVQHDLSLCLIQVTVSGVILATYPFRSTWVANDSVRLEVQGGRYSVYRNGAFLFRATDNNIATGTPGMFYQNQVVAPVARITEWFGGGFGPINTTAVGGIPGGLRRGPGIQPSARFIFQSSPRDTSSPPDVGTPKEPLEWRSGPGIQPRARLMFRASRRSTSPVPSILFAWVGLGVVRTAQKSVSTHVTML